MNGGSCFPSAIIRVYSVSRLNISFAVSSPCCSDLSRRVRCMGLGSGSDLGISRLPNIPGEGIVWCQFDIELSSLRNQEGEIGSGKEGNVESLHNASNSFDGESVSRDESYSNDHSKV